MKKTKIDTIGMFILGLLLFGATTVITSDVLKAGDPTGVTVTLVKAELMENSTASPVTIKDASASPVPVDIVNNPDSLFGEGSIPARTYKRIKLTVQNAINFTAAPLICSAESVTVNRTFFIKQSDGNTTPEALYFATADDGGGQSYWPSGTSSDPFLLQSPVVVEGNATTQLKLIFNMKNKVACNTSNQAILLPLDMNAVNWVEKPPVACTVEGPWWFVHYAVRSNPTMTTTGTPGMDDIINNANVVSGWGRVSFSAPDPVTGVGTWSVKTYQTYTNPDGGMAEHRHKLATYNTDTTYRDEGYFNPVDPIVSAGTSTYVLSGSKLIMTMKGNLEGAMSDDCSAFVGVNITGSDNDLILATKIITYASSTIPDSTKFVIAQPQFELHYTNDPGPPYSGETYTTQWFWYSSDTTVLDTTGSPGSDIMFGWRTGTGFWPNNWAATTTTWTSNGPKEEAELNVGDLASQFSVGSDGLLTFLTDTTDNTVVALGKDGNGIMAGAAKDFDPTHGNHRMTAGFLIDSDPSPALADVAGTWVIGTMESRVESGYTNTAWGTGDETASFGLSYGQMTIDSTGNACGGFTYKDSFTGTISPPDPGCVKLELHTECYAIVSGPTSTAPHYNEALPVVKSPEYTNADCIVPYSTQAGVTLPVFYAIETDTLGNKTVAVKLALNKQKNVIVIWAPVDAGGVPYSASDMCTPGVDCGDGTGKYQFGVGVKIQ